MTNQEKQTAFITAMKAVKDMAPVLAEIYNKHGNLAQPLVEQACYRLWCQHLSDKGSALIDYKDLKKLIGVDD